MNKYIMLQLIFNNRLKSLYNSSMFSDYQPWPSIAILRVPSNLKTTGKVGTDTIGKTALNNPSFNNAALFSLGITRFLKP